MLLLGFESIFGIQKTGKALKIQDAQFNTFADILQQLATEFQVEEIQNFLIHAMEDMS